MAADERRKGRSYLAEALRKRAAEAAGHAQRLQQLVLSLSEPPLEAGSGERRAESQ
jgi:hypothetical protein